MYEYYNNQNQTIANAMVSQEQAKAQKKAEKKANRSKFMKKMGVSLCVGLAFGVMAGFSFAGVTRAVNYFFPEKKAAVVQEISEPEAGVKSEKKEISKAEPIAPVEKNEKTDSNLVAQNIAVGMDVTEIVKNSMPSIVSITNKGVQEVRSMFGMGVQQYESTSAGSGIIIGQNDDELFIVTNNHVIENAKELTVGFIDDEVYTAYVKGYDKDLDLAVAAVKVADLKDSTLDSIKVAIIGDSDALNVGEQVVAIGNALGYGQSVTTGIVSALERDFTDDRIDNPLIQTDAAINPGNSGGALLNMRGELVGINSAKIASTAIEGVGYAIPMSSAEEIIDKLMHRETRDEIDAKDAGYIGISGVSVDKDTSSMYDIPEGVYIQSVEEDSPAEKAGIIKSDILRKFDGNTVSSISEVRKNLDYYKAGETVELVIYRLVDGEYVEKTIEITLGSREGTALDPDNQVHEDENQTDEEEDGESNDEYQYFFNGGNDPFGFFDFFPR